jgi:cytochrome P450
MSLAVSHRRVRSIPLAQWPWVAREFARDRLDATFQLVMRHGHLVRIPHTKCIVVATHPEDIEQILVKHASKYRKSFDYGVLSEVIGTGLLCSDGEVWLRDRRRIQPYFHAKAVSSFFDTMAATADAALDRISDSEAPVSFSSEMTRLALEIMTSRIFGRQAVLDTEPIHRSHAARRLRFAPTSHSNTQTFSQTQRRLTPSDFWASGKAASPATPSSPSALGSDCALGRWWRRRR